MKEYNVSKVKNIFMQMYKLDMQIFFRLPKRIIILEKTANLESKCFTRENIFFLQQRETSPFASRWKRFALLSLSLLVKHLFLPKQRTALDVKRLENLPLIYTRLYITRLVSDNRYYSRVSRAIFASSKFRTIKTKSNPALRVLSLRIINLIQKH